MREDEREDCTPDEMGRIEIHREELDVEDSIASEEEERDEEKAEEDDSRSPERKWK